MFQWDNALTMCILFSIGTCMFIPSSLFFVQQNQSWFSLRHLNFSSEWTPQRDNRYCIYHLREKNIYLEEHQLIHKKGFFSLEEHQLIHKKGFISLAIDHKIYKDYRENFKTCCVCERKFQWYWSRNNFYIFFKKSWFL
jgi:hypothetical protein